MKNVKQRQSEEKRFSSRSRNNTQDRSFKSNSSEPEQRFIHSILKIDTSKPAEPQFRTYSDPIKTPTITISDDMSVISQP